MKSSIYLGHTRTADVACERVQVEHEHPYRAIFDIAEAKRCDLIVMAAYGLRDRPRQRDGKGPHTLQDPGASPSVNIITRTHSPGQEISAMR